MMNINSSNSSPDLSVTASPKIMLSVYNTGNRRLMHNFLNEYFSVEVYTDVREIPERAFDFYILDEQSFHQHKEIILQKKDQTSPVFLPLLLLMPHDSSGKKYHTILENVDDVITIPSAKKLMQSRIQVLMKHREYSLELQKKNQQLEKEKERYRLLAENSSDMISRHAPDGTYLYTSPASKELTGYTPEELTGHNPLKDMHAVDRKRFYKNKDLFKDDEVVRVKYRKTIKDGSQKWVESTLRPIRDDKTGKLIEIQAGNRDITEQVKYEQELKNSLKEKETLLQEIHHRVKNNLAVVSGMLQLQAFNTENEEVQRLLKDSERRIKTMALIHEKLYQSDSLSQLDFGSYIRDLVKNVGDVSADNKNINFRFNCDSFVLNVNQAVPCALILNEVISNSFKHAFVGERKGTITLSIKNQNDWIFVEVSDNGVGLSEEMREKKKKSMGFTIIETLVEQLNADFSISSENGLSTSFCFKKQAIKGSNSSIV